MDWSLAAATVKQSLSQSDEAHKAQPKKKAKVAGGKTKAGAKPTQRHNARARKDDVNPWALPPPSKLMALVPEHAHMPIQQPIRTGSVCTGMNTDGWAWLDLGYAVEKMFFCEKDPTAAKFIRGNFSANTMFRDATMPEFYVEAEAVDVCVS